MWRLERALLRKVPHGIIFVSGVHAMDSPNALDGPCTVSARAIEDLVQQCKHGSHTENSADQVRGLHH